MRTTAKNKNILSSHYNLIYFILNINIILSISCRPRLFIIDLLRYLYLRDRHR